jgi:hypothetical protein
MIEDKYIDFFIGGNINEPVAIEIPFRTKQIGALKPFLEKYGLDIDTDGMHPEKISLNLDADKEGWYSLITPAMNPQDLKNIYKLLYSLVENFQKNNSEPCEILYPHVLDLKNLVTQRDLQTNDTDFIEQLLNDAEHSDDIMVLDDVRDIGKFYHFDDSSLFSGSTMPEPYTVATNDYERYLRYASTKMDQAISYASLSRTKDYNGFRSVLPNGQPVGFLHQYKNREDNQLIFGGAGIENGYETVGKDTYMPETMVNRFNNPLVATYVLWKKPGDTRIYMFKIQENDARWQKFMDYYKTSFYESHPIKRAKINAWIKDGEPHETYVPLRDKSLSLHDFADSVQKKFTDEYEREKQEKQNEVQEKESCIRKYEQLHKTYDAIAKKIQEIKNKIPSLSCRNIACYEKYNNDVLNIVAQYEDIISELEDIYMQMDNIAPLLQDTKYGKYTDSAKENIKNLENDIQSKGINICRQRIKETESLLQQHLKDMTEYPQLINSESDMDIRCKNIIADNILDKAKQQMDQKQAHVLSKAIINLYGILSETEKKQMLQKFEQIRNNSPTILLKYVVENAKKQNCSDIASMFKPKFFDKISKILKFKTHKKDDVENTNTTMVVNRQSVHSFNI